MSTQTKNYQKLTAELQAIIDWFESDKVSLDEAIAKYEQASKLVKQIEAYLKDAENKIHKISAAGKKND